MKTQGGRRLQQTIFYNSPKFKTTRTMVFSDEASRVQSGTQHPLAKKLYDLAKPHYANRTHNVPLPWKSTPMEPPPPRYICGSVSTGVSCLFQNPSLWNSILLGQLPSLEHGPHNGSGHKSFCVPKVSVL